MTQKPVIPVLDFSGIFLPERRLFAPELEGKTDFERYVFSDLEGTVCFCEKGSVQEIRRRLDSLPETARIHWIDTGDFHYLTYFFLERIDRPFSLVLFDNHPDDQAGAFGDDLLSCGGWVRAAEQALPMLRRIVTVGPDAKVFLRERKEDSGPDMAEILVKPIDMAVKVLEDELLRGDYLYLSIDKDVLSPDFARTDWSQGRMTLSELDDLLVLFRGYKHILGVDLCGGITEEKGGKDADFLLNAKLDNHLFDSLLDIII